MKGVVSPSSMFRWIGSRTGGSEVSKSDSNKKIISVNFLENYVTSEGAVSYNVLFYQQLSIYQ